MKTPSMPVSKQQEEDAVALHLPLDRPTGPHRQHAQEGCQQHQREADAVDPQGVIDVEGGDPLEAESLLHPGRPGRELGGAVGERDGDKHRQQEDGHRHAQGEPLEQLVPLLGHEQEHKSPRRRQEDHQAQQDHRVLWHGFIRWKRLITPFVGRANPDYSWS
jgi:hypothetical protein